MLSLRLRCIPPTRVAIITQKLPFQVPSRGGGVDTTRVVFDPLDEQRHEASIQSTTASTASCGGSEDV